MCVYREKSGNYVYDFWWKGRRFKESTRQKSKEEARRFEAALKTDLARGEVGLDRQRSCPQFREFLEKEFMPWSEATHQAGGRTHVRYRVSSVALLKYFSDWMLTEIDPGSVEKYKQWRACQKGKRTGRVLCPATVNRELAALRSILNLAIKQGLIRSNPVRGVRFLREENEQTRVLSFEEEKRYLAAAVLRLREVAVLILNTGMRPEEVYRAKREDVHLMEGYLRVPFGKTRAARRPIPLNRDARALLAARLEKFGTDTYVFPSKLNPGRPMGVISNTHARTVRRAGVASFRLYDLRHTFATRAVQSGMDLTTLAKILGHTKIQMVLRYAHPTPEHARAAMSKLERYMDQSRAGIPAESHSSEAWVN